MASSTDPNFEYDAPTYVDFEDHNFDATDGVDNWFDKHYEDQEGGESTAQMFGFQDNFIPEDPTPQPPPPPPPQQREEAEVTQEEEEEEEEEEEKPAALELPTGQDSGTSAKFLKVLQAGGYQDGRGKKKVAGKNKAIPLLGSPKRAKIEDPTVSFSSHNTPGVLKRYLHKKRQSMTTSQHQSSTKKSTEEREMEEIHRIQREARERIKKSRRSFRMLAKSSKPIPLKGSKPTTVAKEFNFRTRGRERSQQWTGLRQNEVMPNQFANTLRTGSSKDELSQPEATKVRPFKFHLDSRAKEKLTRGPIRAEVMVPVAEAVAKYQTVTPPRFHSSNPRRKRHTSDSSSRNSCSTTGRNNTSCDLTFPKTPNLITRTRSRPVTAKSSAQVEEEEITRINKYQFKANPINREIFTRGGMYGVKQVGDVGVTEPKTPDLATKRRLDQRRIRQREEEEEETFHANPMPNFERILGLPRKRSYVPIVPQSPALQLKRRCLNSRSHDQAAPSEDDGEEDGSGHVIKAMPMPSFDRVFEPQLSHKKTEIQPFVFDSRDKDKPSKETLVQMIVRKTEDKKQQFKAQALPDFSSYTAPKKVAPSNTCVQPFHLYTDLRGEKHTREWEEKITAEEMEQKRNAEFKATDASILYAKPFQPARSSKPLTDRSNIVLHSDVRHQERVKYEAERAKREMQSEQENLQQRSEQEAREAKELVEYRRGLIHKAQGVQHYAPLLIKPSDRPFTVPCSPHLAAGSRVRGGRGYTLQTDV